MPQPNLDLAAAVNRVLDPSSRTTIVPSYTWNKSADGLVNLIPRIGSRGEQLLHVVVTDTAIPNNKEGRYHHYLVDNRGQLHASATVNGGVRSMNGTPLVDFREPSPGAGYVPNVPATFRVEPCSGPDVTGVLNRIIPRTDPNYEEAQLSSIRAWVRNAPPFITRSHPYVIGGMPTTITGRQELAEIALAGATGAGSNSTTAIRYLRLAVQMFGSLLPEGNEATNTVRHAELNTLRERIVGATEVVRRALPADLDVAKERLIEGYLARNHERLERFTARAADLRDDPRIAEAGGLGPREEAVLRAKIERSIPVVTLEASSVRTAGDLEHGVRHSTLGLPGANDPSVRALDAAASRLAGDRRERSSYLIGWGDSDVPVGVTVGGSAIVYMQSGSVALEPSLPDVSAEYERLEAATGQLIRLYVTGGADVGLVRERADAYFTKVIRAEWEYRSDFKIYD